MRVIEERGGEGRGERASRGKVRGGEETREREGMGGRRGDRRRGGNKSGRSRERS